MICEPANVLLDIRRLRLTGLRGLRIDGIRIQIVATPCHFGGERRWFLCPRCNRRCAILYRPACHCRRCAKGHYQSEHLSPIDRKRLKARKLRRQLGGSPIPAHPLPAKPPLMRWHTYLRIRAIIGALEAEVLIADDQRLRRSARAK